VYKKVNSFGEASPSDLDNEFIGKETLKPLIEETIENRLGAYSSLSSFIEGFAKKLKVSNNPDGEKVQWANIPF
tara:strand:- start:11802 stop:12023 length:222 start_codon:yes stop_codon:yes gene_type:complete